MNHEQISTANEAVFSYAWFFLECSTLEDGTDKFSQNVSKELQLPAA